MIYRENLDLKKLDEQIVIEIKQKSVKANNMCNIFSLSPIISSNILDLKTENMKNYLIFLHGTNTIVGCINYRGYHIDDYSGDIDAFIIPYYRGNGYAYEALVLLSNVLYKNNVFSFWVSTFKDNFASIKTIEKFGGYRIIPISHSDNNVILYECSTFNKKLDGKSSKVLKLI